MSCQKKKRKITITQRNKKNSFDYSFWNMRLFQLLSLRNSECFWVCTCNPVDAFWLFCVFHFLLALGLYRYPSRLMSHCQGSCPIGKFSQLLSSSFRSLPLTVKNSGIFCWFSFPFMYLPFVFFFFFIRFLSFLLLFLLSLVPQALIFRFLCFTGFTGSFFDSISVISQVLFQHAFPSNQCLCCLKLQWSSISLMGYLPYCDKKDDLSSALFAAA